MSDSFAAGFSYGRGTSAQDTNTKETLRKTSSDAPAVTDPVWKRPSGGSLPRQTSSDAGRTKPFLRQLSKGVSKLDKFY